MRVISLLAKSSILRYGDDDPKPDDKKIDDPKPDEKKYTQKDLDKHIGGYKFKVEAELKKAENSARQLAEDKRLTQEERDAHAKRADDIEAQYKTQKELEEQRVARLSDTHKKEIETEKANTIKYRTRYETKLIDSELSDGINSADEPIPGKLKKYIRQDTVLVDEIDSTGKVTGEQVVRVKFPSKDKEGKVTELLLTVKEAVKAMKEDPEEYGIFFKGATSGGTGGNSLKGGSGGSSTAMPKDIEEYMRRRSANKSNK